MDFNVFCVAIGVGAVYFLPSIIAMADKRKQKNAIAVLNFFLGWTIIGWLGALIWACMKDAEPTQVIQQVKEELPTSDNICKLERLAKLKANNLITDEEYNELKRKLIES